MGRQPQQHETDVSDNLALVSAKHSYVTSGTSHK